MNRNRSRPRSTWPRRDGAGADPVSAESGTALIVALWVLISLALLIGSFAFDMHIEAGITSFYRKRLKAQYLAQAGVEWSKMVLAKSFEVSQEEEGDDELMLVSAINLSRGVSAQQRTQQMGDGSFIVDILPEQGRYNVNTIDDEQWIEILDYANVPLEQWDELIDCFIDWKDDNDLHQLNGAESDDSFYVERGYEVKNGPLDTVDELLLIKGFTESIVYGGPAEEEGDAPLLGIARSLTTWGDGKVNINTASRDVLMTLPGVDEAIVDEIIAGRYGLDGEPGTRDDGFESVQEVMNIPGIDPTLAGRITTTERSYVRVVSIGEVQEVRSGIWCILQVDKKGAIPLYWREESME